MDANVPQGAASGPGEGSRGSAASTSGALRGAGEAALESLMRSAPDGIVVVDAAGRIMFVSDRATAMFGYDADELIGRPVEVLVPGHAEPLHAAQRAAFMRRPATRPMGGGRDLTGRRRDGSEFPVEIGLGVADLDGEPIVTAVVTDIGERKRAEQALRESEATLRSVLQSAPDGIVIVDDRAHIVMVSDRGARMFGYDPGELLGRPVEVLVPERLRATHVAMRDRFLVAPETRPMGHGRDLTLRHRDGSELPVEIGLGVADQGSRRLVTAVVTDISARREAEAKLLHQAMHDHLTGLPNRALLLDRLRVALARNARRDGGLAVLFLDLDRFKVVNDSLGHDAGDRLLREVAERLRRAVRPSDTVARFGGDEFAVLCDGLGDESRAVAIARRVLAAVSAPFTLDRREVVVTPSVGIAMAGPTSDAGELLRDADAAMYRAKERGRSRWELFDESTRAAALGRLETEHALRRAIEREELTLVYQPVVSLTTGEVLGAEALVRWPREGYGVLGPGSFMDLAEETGLIVPLGDLVLREALRRLARWQQRGVPLPRVSVNLSAHQIADPELPRAVAAALDRERLDPSSLVLEITESVLMEDPTASAAVLRDLRSLGVSLAIDDFGTGYSSLAYLRRFPVDFLKVDRSFVQGLGQDGEDATIVAAVVGLAHALGITALAEGVETEEALEALRRLGCDQAQGYLFLPPQPAAVFAERLAGVARAAAAALR